MSLHTLAQHLQSAGRGDDRVLVHMTSGEVSGLQSLAMAHGGSLTINPETGLPEAGFLSSILPMVAGAALTVASGGAINPLTAGLITGAAGTVATGSLSKGLMMGLGAYGGAGLAGGLGGAAAAGSAAASAAPTATAAAAPIQGYTGSLLPAGAPATVGAASTVPVGLQAATSGTGIAAQPVVSQPAGLAGVQGGTTALSPPVVSTAPATPASAPSVEAATSMSDRFKTMGGNIGKLFGSSEEDKAYRDAFLKENKMPLIAGGLSALSLSREEPKMQQERGGYTLFNPTYNRIAQSGGQYQAGAYPSATGERRYFADGGLADLPVEQMSQQASTGQNTNYPMANIRPYGYAVPRNTPISENVFKPMDYQNVDPYTGEQKLAGGGLASLVSMATGGFVSQLKAVNKPAEPKPQLKSTAALEKQIANLEKYSNVDEIYGQRDSIKAQINDLKASKASKDAEAKQAKIDLDKFIAETNKEKAGQLKSINSDYSATIKRFQDDKSLTPQERSRMIADVQKEQKDAQARINNDYGGMIKNRQSEYSAFTKDLGGFNTDYTKQLNALNTDLGKTNNVANFAKQYQTAVANRDKLIAENEKITGTAQQKFEADMAKYNEYQDKLSAEKQAWQEETGRKATGIQAIRPQTTTTTLGRADPAKLAELQRNLENTPYWDTNGKAYIQKQIDELKAGSSSGYTPAYIKDPKTGRLIPSSEAPPITEFKPFTKVPGYDTTRRLMEEKDITAVFEDVAGRRPTAAEMQKFLGTQTTDAALAQFAMNQPDVKATVQYTDDDFRENFQYYNGREPTSGEMAAMKKANIKNFNQMRNFLQQQPAYLKNLNTVAQQAFQSQQKSAEEAMAEQARMSASLTPEQVATAYQDVLGRTPTMEELRQYMGAQQTQEGLAGVLKGSEEYLQKLTQPLVPGLSGGKYAPGTVLEYTPQQQAPTGLGAITSGLQPTPSGLQAPMTRGAVSIEGALPLNPTFQEQMGLQTLATQAAEQAPALQTGLKFEAQQPQNIFGFQPYAANQLPQIQPYPPANQSPQSIEAVLAALREQQLRAMPQATGMAEGGYAGGGYHLGDYSDGGRLLKGPGDGVSDSIPASIGGRQPARLADGEFVIPARIVSELGNGSTDAGARKLYAMMERVQRARRKSVGRDKVAVDSKAEKLLPA